MNRFGRWQVIGEPFPVGRWKKVLCRCDCGTERAVFTHLLKQGTTRSCGCLRVDSATGRSPANKTHGKAGTRIYDIWVFMKHRCYNSNNRDFHLYGGRGIKVCKRWLKFENFYEDMGEPPTGHSLGRINNNGPYSKKNCRWETAKQQANNRTTSVLITLNGETLTAQEWSERTGIKAATVYYRYHRGWPAHRILAP